MQKKNVTLKINDVCFDLYVFYFIYMKRDWAGHRCYVEALLEPGFEVYELYEFKQSSSSLYDTGINKEPYAVMLSTVWTKLYS